MALATNTAISFTVPAVPVAQPRQRHRAAMINGKPISMNYTPRDGTIQTFKATCAMAARAVYQGPPLQGPIWLEVDFVFPRTCNQIWKTKSMPRLRHAKKPDRENCEKALLDALTGILFVDDCQVCDGPVRKWIASGDEQPHVEVTIRCLD